MRSWLGLDQDRVTGDTPITLVFPAYAIEAQPRNAHVKHRWYVIPDLPHQDRMFASLLGQTMLNLFSEKHSEQNTKNILVLIYN